MKTNLKKSISIMLAGLMTALSMMSVSAETPDTPDTPKPENSLPALYVDGNPNIPSENENSSDVIKWFSASHKGLTMTQLDKKPSSKSYFLFLPTTANLSELTVWHNFSEDPVVNGVSIKSGEKTNVFSETGKYTMTVEDENYTVTVMQSKSIGSMYISTESGTMNNVHADKEKKESGDIIIVEADGTQDYNGELSFIKGRGNTTWKLGKKPYNIKLDKKASVLGMDASKKWCLLANTQDHSMIRNKIAYDMADELGLDFAPDSDFVDLYLNGEYAGVYQVSEKVEVGKNNLVKITDLEELTEKANDKSLDKYPQVKPEIASGSVKYFDIPNDPADITGGYLLEFNGSAKYNEEASGFVTEKGHPIVVKSPEYASKRQIEYISKFYQELEDALFSITGRNSLGKHYSEYIDVESAALMYLLEEYSLDIDAGSGSCFMYKESDSKGDGKIHIAPAWDFDVAFGNLDTQIDDTQRLNDPTTIYVSKRYDFALENCTIFSQLCTHKDFCDKVKELYNEKFAPVLEILNSDETKSGNHLKSFDVYRTQLEPSAEMNYTRWKMSDNILVGGIGKTFDKQFDYLVKFAKERAVFFNEHFNKAQQAGDKLNIYFQNYYEWEHVYLYYINGKNQIEWPGIEMKPIEIGDFENIYKADLAALGEVDNGDIRFVIHDGGENSTTHVQAQNNIALFFNIITWQYDDGHIEKKTFTAKETFDESKIVTVVYTVGDVNNDGEIKSDDALKILRFSAEIEYPGSYQDYICSLIDDDNEITSADALLVLRNSVGLEDKSHINEKIENTYYNDGFDD